MPSTRNRPPLPPVPRRVRLRTVQRFPAPQLLCARLVRAPAAPRLAAPAVLPLPPVAPYPRCRAAAARIGAHAGMCPASFQNQKRVWVAQQKAKVRCPRRHIGGCAGAEPHCRHRRLPSGRRSGWRSGLPSL